MASPVRGITKKPSADWQIGPIPQASDGAITATDLKQAAALAQGRISRSRQHGKKQKNGFKSVYGIDGVDACLDARSGSVLDSQTILKTDYVPSHGDKNIDGLFPINIGGTFNLRQSLVTKVFGVAQPTIAGIRGLLNVLEAGRTIVPSSDRHFSGTAKPNVVWINLREEPTLYINGRCNVLRDRNEPFHNIDDFQGMDAKRIHDMERRLKEDVVEESMKFGGNIILHEERRRRELDTTWEGVGLDDIKSPMEVFFSLQMLGYRVKYERIPTTPEKAPTTQFFDSIVKVLMETTHNTTIVFNCQTGGGRSTVGMVAAGLVQMWRGVIKIPKQIKFEDSPTNTAAKPLPFGAKLNDPHPFKSEHIVRVLSGAALSSLEDSLLMQTASVVDDSNADGAERQLEAGWYQPVLHLIRLVDSGRVAKKHVDFFCNDASQLVDLRAVIFSHRNRAIRERHHASEKFKLMRASTSLLRYVMLVAFDAYLSAQVRVILTASDSPKNNAAHKRRSSHFEFMDKAEGTSARPGLFVAGPTSNTTTFPISFTDWLDSRPEIVRLLSSIEKEPKLALETVPISSEVSHAEGMGEMRSAMKSRRGSMLNTDTILKADHFPGGMVDRSRAQTAFDVCFRGAPNFRNVEGTRVYGVCTPTMDAAREIVLYIQEASNAKRIVWTNLREEAVVYINEQPFVLRSVREPFRNVNEFISIDSERLEAAERRLKEDVVAELKRYNGRILVHEETDDKTLRLLWEHVEEDDILTPREMYQALVDSGLPVEYFRVPLTPEQPPSPDDIDTLLRLVEHHKAQEGTHFVFNCQMGRGRSTIAMIIACLALERSDGVINEEFLDHLMEYGKKNFKMKAPRLKDDAEDRRKLLAQGSAKKIKNISSVDSDGDAYSSCGELIDEPDRRFGRGETGAATPPIAPSQGDDLDSSDDDENVKIHEDDEFSVILSLLRVLTNGVVAKKWADSIIDKCGTVENIRLNISEFVERASTARSTKRAAEMVERGLLNLRRYFVLILVSAYETMVAQGCNEVSFTKWFFLRPELKTIFNGIRGKDALRFASVDRVLSAPPPAEGGETLGLEEQDIPGEEADEAEKDVFRYVARRRGMVLTRGSILKSDHFPGCNRLKNAAVAISGAPNFRAITIVDTNAKTQPPMPNLGIYGVGIPTVEGLEGVLGHVNQGDSQKEIVWINLREEPILYVNGRPFVLRKLEHPFENLEHTGISKERVEGMEDRLKVDVINEILENNGRLLLHDEDTTGLQPIWEAVDVSEGSTAVQTPRDLYAMLARTTNVQQYRVPITDEQAPKVTDYDEISTIVRNTPLKAEIVFNCQMGRGRTTTGLVIAATIRLWARNMLGPFPTLVEKLVNTGAVTLRSRITRKGGFSPEPNANPEEKKLLGGHYGAIGTLCRILEHGADAKKSADAVIDICDSMQNLREAIYDLKVTNEDKDKSPAQRAAAFNRGVHYLRRYYQIIEFAQYMFTLNPSDVTAPAFKTFSIWLQERPELKTIIKRTTFTGLD
mmetsp:Transcript_12515/g.22690  ORF Transcript_12515/g.22690 Transcript_12515/m.22690 type:complete len:1511 (+) Transcript_12515:216-4748(+)|eukprot:CAMPEP_0203764362 /NCGR_PEP_ID=MMETSP0098-20131031/17641_1 /ASSEMBLY_ACC=CAM_ASM_000208 /TAXON_ID=96639 /ORGANISM=" , Strain NY0313808BC1" /LENGTH=1510 /DNA_ID=CAMNT_0050660201 /DNA_START=155 /DNA_END=4687 /DNA_ORIENTATION=+